MNVRLSKEFKQVYPKLKIGILEVRGIANRKRAPELDKRKREAEKELRKRYASAKEIPLIQEYGAFYKQFKKTYPVEFQVQGILDGNEASSESAIVEAMFLAELKNMFLTAGHDLDTIEGPLQTMLATGSEEYMSIGGKTLQLRQNDIVTADEKGIVSSVLLGPDRRTRITEQTTNCLFFSYFPYGAEDETIERHFADILGNLAVFTSPASSDVRIFGADEMVVTPWEVSGKIDYDKLIKRFGVHRIDEKLHARLVRLAGGDHRFLRRDIFFAHTNLDKILDAIERKQPVWLYTGRAPSGPVHLGHAVPWMFAHWLQERLGLHLLFQIPDEEKALFKENVSFEDGARWLEENILDIIAMGFDPEKTKILIDTRHADLMYKIACQVARKTTASTAKSLFGLSDSDNVGKYFYTCMQSVPAFLPTVLEGKPTNVLIPCAIDQDVHFRLTRDVAPKLGYPKPSTILCRFLPALSGGGKLSSSEENIAMTDDPKSVRKKIMKYAFSGGKDTVDEHRMHGGNPDVDIAYQWLTFFEQDDARLERIRKDYVSGKLLSGELKQMLVDTLVPLMQEHQKRRERAKGRIGEFLIR
jgi:tryptophanyl-tRNA synthetase